MDKISTIKQNILYFVESQGFRKEDFFNKIEISYSNFKGKSLFSEIGADKIVKILTNYPELNPDWLLTGKGEMLRNSEEKKEELSEKDNKYILSLERNVELLEKNLKQCEDEKKLLKNNKSNV